MNRNNQLILVASGCLWFWTIADQAGAATPVGVAPDASEVRKVLVAETKGESAGVNRREALQPSRHKETTSSAAWWQSGFVKVADVWLEVEDSHAETDLVAMDAYRTQRAATPRTAEGQLKLANWCESRKLKDQERSHLTQVLILSDSTADRSQICRRMGYRLVGENWVSPSDFQDMKQLSQ